MCSIIKFYRCLYERTQVEHRISSAYHPQTNGLDERTNQTLTHTLRKMMTETKEWDDCIDAALYAYRISVQDSSKFSPFFLMYNRHPRKAIDYELATADGSAENPVLISNAAVTTHQTISKVLEMREEYHKKAHRNIEVAQERQKTYYDAKHDSNHVSFFSIFPWHVYSITYINRIFIHLTYFTFIYLLDDLYYYHAHLLLTFFLGFCSWVQSSSKEYEELSQNGWKNGSKVAWSLHSGGEA